MKKKCESCHSCGMPFHGAEDHALGMEQNEYCKYCTDENGRLKPYDQVLSQFTDFLVHSQSLDRSAAKNMAQEMMGELPAWNKRK